MQIGTGVYSVGRWDGVVSTGSLCGTEKEALSLERDGSHQKSPSFGKQNYLFKWHQVGAASSEKTHVRAKKLEWPPALVFGRDCWQKVHMLRLRGPIQPCRWDPVPGQLFLPCSASLLSLGGRMWRKEVDHGVIRLRSDSVLHCRQLPEVTWGQCLALLADSSEHLGKNTVNGSTS